MITVYKGKDVLKFKLWPEKPGLQFAYAVTEQGDWYQMIKGMYFFTWECRDEIHVPQFYINKHALLKALHV